MGICLNSGLISVCFSKLRYRFITTKQGDSDCVVKIYFDNLNYQ